MNPSLAAQSPLVKTFTLSVIRDFPIRFPAYRKENVINVDIIPRVSKKVFFQKPVRTEKIEHPAEILKREKNDLNILTKPITVKPSQPSVKVPLVYQTPYYLNNRNQGEYGKISPLLNDNSVSTIECSGPGKTISVIRQGQKQVTRISLLSDEIKKILEKISNEAHIPLIEGAFKVAVDNFVINAVVSDAIGSRFIIKKTTPYSLIEPMR